MNNMQKGFQSMTKTKTRVSTQTAVLTVVVAALAFGLAAYGYGFGFAVNKPVTIKELRKLPPTLPSCSGDGVYASTNYSQTGQCCFPLEQDSAKICHYPQCAPDKSYPSNSISKQCCPGTKQDQFGICKKYTPVSLKSGCAQLNSVSTEYEKGCCTNTSPTLYPDSSGEQVCKYGGCGDIGATGDDYTAGCCYGVDSYGKCKKYLPSCASLGTKAVDSSTGLCCTGLQADTTGTCKTPPPSQCASLNVHYTSSTSKECCEGLTPDQNGYCK
jgi:hypothetical protein